MSGGIRSRPFLVLQVRPESEAADEEYAAILARGALAPDDTVRVRLDLEPDVSALLLERFAAVIVGGGPGCVSDPPDEQPAIERRMQDAVLSLMPRIVENDLPFLGCCYGIGVLARHLGGEVSRARHAEPVGATDCTLTEEGRHDPLLRGFPARFRAFVGHKEALQALPPGCVHLVSSLACPYQMIRHGQHVYATQFHPEADAQSFVVRIGVYRDRGYFPADDAERLIAACRAEDTRAATGVLRNFVNRYRCGTP